MILLRHPTADMKSDKQRSKITQYKIDGLLLKQMHEISYKCPIRSIGKNVVKTKTEESCTMVTLIVGSVDFKCYHSVQVLLLSYAKKY